MWLRRGLVAVRDPFWLSRPARLASSRSLWNSGGVGGCAHAGKWPGRVLGNRALPNGKNAQLFGIGRGWEAAQIIDEPRPLSSLSSKRHSPLLPRLRGLDNNGFDERFGALDPRKANSAEQFLPSAYPAQVHNARLMSSGRSGQDGQSRLQRLAGGVGAATLLLWGKAKWVLVGLKFTKVLPAMSLLASTAAYGFFYGWPFAVGMVGQIFIHESGHVLAMKKLGIPSGPMTFIPFVGAVVEMRGRPTDVTEEAIVALGGPIAGGLAAVSISAAGVATGSNLLIALADFGIFINLFNLLPLGMLDGGRIAGAVSPYFLVAGLGGGVALAVTGMVSNPLFYLILLSGGFTCYDRFFGHGTHPSYYQTSSQARLGIFSLYLALIAALLLAYAWNKSHKKSIRQLRRENPDVQFGGVGAQLERFADDWKDEDERIREMEAEHERKFFGDRSF